MTKFEAGKKYSFEWYCEDGGTSRLTIVSRTEKTVVISYKGEQKRKKIYVDSNGEYIMPTGSYSMAPICRAENICETEIETENTQEEKTQTENTQEENTITEITKFEAGKTYSVYGDCKGNGTSTLTIVARRGNTVVIDYNYEQKQRKIYVDNNGEYIMPEGRYSMAPICYAEDILETENTQEENTTIEETMPVEQIIEAVKTETYTNALHILDAYSIPQLKKIAVKVQQEHCFEDDYINMNYTTTIAKSEIQLKLWLKIWIMDEIRDIKLFRPN